MPSFVEIISPISPSDTLLFDEVKVTTYGKYPLNRVIKEDGVNKAGIKYSYNEKWLIVEGQVEITETLANGQKLQPVTYIKNDVIELKAGANLSIRFKEENQTEGKKKKGTKIKKVYSDKTYRAMIATNQSINYLILYAVMKNLPEKKKVYIESKVFAGGLRGNIYKYYKNCDGVNKQIAKTSKNTKIDSKVFTGEERIVTGLKNPKIEAAIKEQGKVEDIISIDEYTTQEINNLWAIVDDPLNYCYYFEGDIENESNYAFSIEELEDKKSREIVDESIELSKHFDEYRRERRELRDAKAKQSIEDLNEEEETVEEMIDGDLVTLKGLINAVVKDIKYKKMLQEFDEEYKDNKVETLLANLKNHQLVLQEKTGWKAQKDLDIMKQVYDAHKEAGEEALIYKDESLFTIEQGQPEYKCPIEYGKGLQSIIEKLQK